MDEIKPAPLPKELWRVIRHDPQHLPERLIVLAQKRLAGNAWEWGQHILAEQPNATPEEIIAQVNPQLERFARVNGALAGTPFLIALVPAYVSVLWEEARMVMAIASLNGRDPREPEFAGELLALRGLYETPGEAMAELQRLSEDPVETKKTREDEDSAKGWFASWSGLVYRILILAGFLSPSKKEDDPDRRSKLMTAVSLAGGLTIYLITCLVPVTFMILMSWSCESDVRTLTDRSSAWYGEGLERDNRRFSLKKLRTRDESGLTITRALLALLSLAIPMVLIFAAVANPVKHATLYAAASLIGLLIVLILGSQARRFRSI